jgi:AcrR family transcriptional regulator
VRTAMRLWTERGFETGIEDTTVDEIVAAAGVTKGTFYFHFAHKEEILLELGYQTAATSVKAAPPAAVGRAMSEFMRPRRPGDEPMEMAQIIEALYTDCLIEWSRGRLKWLNPALQRRTSIVLAGLRPGAAFPAPEKP